MNTIDDTEPRYPIGYLLFKKVRIHDANSISSPITYGFPTITGFLGAFHAMSRKVQADAELSELSLGGVLLACHECEPQVYRPSSYSNYTFNQSRNPIKKDGKTASIIEEGKCHLTMTFVVEVLGDDELSKDEQQSLIKKSTQWIQQHRMAGGSVQSLARFEPVQYIDYQDIDTVIPQLMPAFVLMDAQAEFLQIIQELQLDNPSITPLDALLDVCTIHHLPQVKKNNEVKWENYSVKKGRGWLVPMPIGYQGIADKYQAGVMQNVRNPEYPSQYVEAIYGLGKWLYPYHLKTDDKILSAFWRYSHDDEKQLYLTTQTH
ncbi:MAG: type I-F CRISPR-associated protein Csy2 [Gammaproteobacteria bacterium]|nr:MAG: type I-F CRISPR-associated protein Csy2 [Gammaproteobacteria bacterium]